MSDACRLIANASMGGVLCAEGRGPEHPDQGVSQLELTRWADDGGPPAPEENGNSQHESEPAARLNHFALNVLGESIMRLCHTANRRKGRTLVGVVIMATAVALPVGRRHTPRVCGPGRE
jgi:hypothetical protein